MTEQPMIEEMALLERLRAKNTLGPRPDGKVGIALIYDNPDGPEAADTIEAQATYIRETAAVAYLMGMADTDEAHAAMILRAGRDEEHHGDCTGAPITCTRCICDEALEAADKARTTLNGGQSNEE
jgi:catalase (peroxidase I)